MTTPTAYESECRMFAAQHPTPNTLRAIALGESGQLAWCELHALFTASLAAAIYEVEN